MKKLFLLQFKRISIFIFLLCSLVLTLSLSIKAEEVVRDYNYYLDLTNQLYTKKGYKGLYEFLLFSKPIYNFEKDEKEFNLYSVLNDEQKQIYDKLLNDFKTLDKPINEYKNDSGDAIEFQFSFDSKTPENSDKVNERLNDYTQVAILLYQDHPDLFFTTSILTNASYIEYPTYTKYLIKISYKHQFGDITSDQFLNIIKEYIAKREYITHEVVLKDTNNDKIISNFERVKNAHDWLYENNEYNQEALKVENKDKFETRMSHRSVSGFLSDYSPVCEGYAFSFKSLMNRVGVSTIIGTGKGYSTETDFEAHAWNYVFLDEKWYLLDVTWDDPIGATLEKHHYNYFLKPRQKDHVLYKKGDNQDGQVLEFVIKEPSPMSEVDYDMNNPKSSATSENIQKDTLFTALNKKEPAPSPTPTPKPKPSDKDEKKDEKKLSFLNKKYNLFGLEIDVLHIILAFFVLVISINYLVLLFVKKTK